MRVMTFNIQHCEDYFTQKIDYDEFASVIKNSGADIIGLNEVRGEGVGEGYDAQAEILAKKLGFYYFFAPIIHFNNGGPYGNAFLSRYPVTSAEIIKIPDPEEKKYNDYYETRCIINAEISAPCGNISLCVTHFGLNPDEQSNAVKAVLENIKKERFILTGDFNATPDCEILRPIKERLFDTAQSVSDGLLSYPSDNPDRKIDYIFVSRDIKVKNAQIMDTQVSDQRPYFTDIEL